MVYWGVRIGWLIGICEKKFLFGVLLINWLFVFFEELGFVEVCFLFFIEMCNVVLDV